MKKQLIIAIVCLGVIILVGRALSKQELQWFEYTDLENINTERMSTGEKGVNLGISDIRWDRFAPVNDVGWCGEASLQMAAMYNGVYLSQWRINELGQAKHTDLYAGEIEPAMNRMGLQYETYQNRDNQTVEDYIGWIEQKLKEGKPVFSGMKLYPGGNPEWHLDHFVLMVGYENEHLIYNANTPGKGQIIESYKGLASKEDGYRLNNDFNKYFGRAIVGFKEDSRRIIPKLHILGESDKYVSIGITAEGLEVGKEYILQAIPFNHDFTAIEEENVEHITEFVATEQTMRFKHEKIKRQEGYYYRVVEKDKSQE